MKKKQQKIVNNFLSKCPHCNSDKGYKYDYTISGTGSETKDFKGNVLDCDRNTYDNVDKHSIVCINCGQKLDINKIDI